MFSQIVLVAVSALAAVIGVASTPLAARRSNDLGSLNGPPYI